HEEGAEEPLERVATGDAERRPDRPRRRDVHQERAQEQGRPDAVAEQQRRGRRVARRRPARRRARVDEGERQPELPGEEVDAGEHEEAPRYEGSAEHAYLEVLPRGFLVPGQATRGRAGEAYASPAARTASVRLEDYFLATVLGGTLALSATVTGAAAHAVPARRRARRALVAPTARGGAARLVVLALEVAHDLPKVLLCEQALPLHLLEHSPPALTAFHLRDLVGSQPRRAGLRLEQGPGDLLLAGGELTERARPGRLRPCADRHQDEGDNRPDHDPPHRCPPLPSLLPAFPKSFRYLPHVFPAYFAYLGSLKQALYQVSRLVPGR